MLAVFVLSIDIKLLTNNDTLKQFLFPLSERRMKYG